MINTDIIEKYYVYYEQKSGELLCVTNEKNDSYEHGIEVDYNDVKKLLSGEWKFKDYRIGYKDTNDKSSIGLLSNDQFYLDYSFKNKTFEWITTNKKADVIVEWNEKHKSWIFSLSSDFKKTYNSNILESQVMFFVTLETDLDFLIRTIFIKIDDLITNPEIKIPFDSNLENKIDKISIGTKIVFRSYGLRKIYE